MRAAILSLIALCLMLVAGAARAQGNSAAGFQNDPLAAALQHSDVYVGKALRDRIDSKALQTAAGNASNLGVAKIVVVNDLPASGSALGTRDAYTQALHRFLNLGPGLLLIVDHRGVSASTTAVPADRIASIVRDNVAAIQQDPVNGIQATVQALNAAAAGSAPPAGGSAPPDTGAGSVQPAPADASGPSAVLWILPVAAGLGGALWLGSRAAKKSQAMQQARIPVDRLHREVVEGISYADTYLDLLPPASGLDAAVQKRQEAAALLEQAMRFRQAARTPDDLGRAQALLEQAKAQIAAVRGYIDQATGGTGFAVAVEGTDYRATPATGGGTAASQGAPIVPGLSAEDIPAAERGACFFCSRPARISDLIPITIALEGQRRKVLACPEDVEIVRRGATPEVRSTMDNGRAVPWFRSRSYDPYRDYGRTEVYYTPAYGGMGGYGSGLIEGMFLGSLFSEPAVMPYPVFMSPSGYATNDPIAAAPPVAFDDMGQNPGDWPANDNVGGADFGSQGDFGSPDPTGGADFGSTDTGGADFGGSDFGSSDSGGFDAGGSDFGGGDSGGGDY